MVMDISEPGVFGIERVFEKEDWDLIILEGVRGMGGGRWGRQVVFLRWSRRGWWGGEVYERTGRP